jgi:hypothetical protein
MIILQLQNTYNRQTNYYTLLHMSILINMILLQFRYLVLKSNL